MQYTNKTVPINREENGTIYAELVHEEDTLSLEIFPDGERFRVSSTRGNFESNIYSLPGVRAVLEDDSIFEWIAAVLNVSPVHPYNKLGNVVVDKYFTVDGVEYSIRLNVRKGTVIFCTANKIVTTAGATIDAYQELRVIGKGVLYDALIEHINKAKTEKLELGDEIRIGRYMYGFHYSDEHDMLTIKYPRTLIKTTVTELTNDIPELPYVANGRLLEKVRKIMLEDGVQFHR